MLPPAPADAPAAFSADPLCTVLANAANGMVWLRPEYAAGEATPVDFAYACVNPAAQQRLGLPAYPTRSYARQPGATPEGLAALRAAFGAPKPRPVTLPGPAGAPAAPCPGTAQRLADGLLVTLTDEPTFPGPQLNSLNAVLASLRELVFLFDTAGRFRYANQALLDLWGRTLEEAVGKTFSELGYPPAQARQLHAQVLRVVATGQPVAGETAYTSPAGAEGYYEYTFVPLLDERGQLEGVAGRAQPLTAERAAQAALRASEAKYRTLFESLDEGFCILQLYFDEQNRAVDFGYLETNRAFEQQTGLRDVVGRRVREVVPDAEPFWLEAYGQVALGGEPLRTVSRALGRWFEVHAFRVGEPADRQVAVVFNDVTVRQQAEEALRASEAHFRFMADALPQIIWIVDAAGRTEFFNRQWTRYTGRPFEPTTAAQVAATAVHPDDAARTMAYFEEASRRGERFEVEHRIRSASGEYRWFLVRAEPYHDPQTGQVLRWFGTSVDIHDRKCAEESLRRSEEQFRLFVTASSDLVYRMSPDWRQMYALKGKGFLADTNAPSSAWGDHYIPDDEVPRVEAAIMQALRTRSMYELEHRVIQADGSVGWMFSRAIPVLDEQGNITQWLGAASDVTARKRAEEQLQAYNEQLQRVNTDLDTFIYTASHDLKAPITNIEGLVHALQAQLPPEVQQTYEVAPLLRMVEDSVARFLRTIEHLSDVVKLQKENEQFRGEAALPPVVADVCQDLQPLVQQTGAQLDVDVEGCPSVALSAKNLRSVVYNLLSNALKYHRPDQPPRVQINCREQAGFVVLTVQDNGLGIDPQRHEDLFVMFRRLHTHVEGSGVGLYMVKRIVENAGGRIDVQSQRNAGAAFRVWLPRI